MTDRYAEPEHLGSTELASYVNRMFTVSEHKFRDPGTGKVITRTGVHMGYPGAVVVLPLEGDFLVFTRQYRHIARRFMLELPAGRIDANETALDAARRELAEECGLAAESMEEIVRNTFVSPGWVDERQVFFVARGLSPAVAEQDEGENVRPVRIHRDVLSSMLVTGELDDSKSLALIGAWLLSGGA